jgi:uncharacterized ubiquitin-like protein YukD
MSTAVSTSLVRITIITQGDEQHVIEAPLDLRANEFIDELKGALKLASTDAQGQPISWRLDNKDTGQTLVGEQTLEQNGVCEGHRLNLFRSVVAGSR